VSELLSEVSISDLKIGLKTSNTYKSCLLVFNVIELQEIFPIKSVWQIEGLSLETKLIEVLISLKKGGLNHSPSFCFCCSFVQVEVNLEQLIIQGVKFEKLKNLWFRM